MMLDHVRFSCLQFPEEWGTPKFKLGDTVLADGEYGVVVGVNYESPLSYDPDFDSHCLGWWFMVVTPHQVGNRILKHVSGYHQDVIQPVLTVGNGGIQHQQPGITATNTLEPLMFGVF